MRAWVEGEIKVRPIGHQLVMLMIPVPASEAIDEVLKWQAKGEPLALSVSRNALPRSNAANAFCWGMCNAISEKTGVPKTYVYKTGLRDYSSCGGYITFPELTAKAQIRALEESHIYAFPIGKTEVGGKAGVECELYYGTTHFDSKDMYRLLQGLKQECSTLGIVLRTEKKIEKMIVDMAKGEDESECKPRGDKPGAD